MSKETKPNNTEAETATKGAQPLDESELEAVAGGEEEDIDAYCCNFRPFVPTKHKVSGSQVWVKCTKPQCTGCLCRSSARCKSEYHLMEKVVGTVWGPYPLDELIYRHQNQNKAVRDLTDPRT